MTESVPGLVLFPVSMMFQLVGRILNIGKWIVVAIEPPPEISRMRLTDGFRQTFSFTKASNSPPGKTGKRSTSGPRRYEFFVSDNDLACPTGSSAKYGRPRIPAGGSYWPLIASLSRYIFCEASLRPLSMAQRTI